MSKFWKIWIAASWLLIAVYLSATTWYWPSKIEQAYERGYKDASWFVVYDIEANPTVVTDNLGRTWYRIDSKCGVINVDSTYYVLTLLYDKDSLLVDIWGQKIRVDHFDSTDTMPAVEKEKPQSLRPGL